MRKYLKYVLPKLVVLILLTFGAVTEKNLCKFIFLAMAGIISGIYNGYYNDIQWRAQSDEEEHKDKKLPEDYLNNKFIDAPYRVHQMFNHIVCGVIAAICFYLLLSKINLAEPLTTIKKLTWGDFILFIFVLTGFTGILPRAIWYWSYGPRIKG